MRSSPQPSRLRGDCRARAYFWREFLEGPACRARKPSLSPASFYLSKENPTATVSRRPAGRAVSGTQLSGPRRAQPPALRSSSAGTARAPPRDGPRHPERCFGVCFISRCVRGGDARHKGKPQPRRSPPLLPPPLPSRRRWVPVPRAPLRRPRQQNSFPVGLSRPGASSRVRNVWFPPALGTVRT